MQRFVVGALLALTIPLALALAQESEESGSDEAAAEEQTEEVSFEGDVNLFDNEDWGQHLVDAQGRALYIYMEDEQGAGTSTCVDRCVENWPPATVEGDPEPGEGVDDELIGTIERDDGTMQLTYNGWPLYRSARDAEQGHTRGQMVGNAFFLLSAGGESVTEQVEDEADVDEEQLADLREVGQDVYATNCQVCHGEEGGGGIGPALAGNSVLDDTQFVVERIINGFPDHGMPPFGHLSDEQIAGVSTFIRTSWENDFGAVTADEVADFR